MRGMMVAALCAGLLAAGSQGAEAKGCIKGMIVGGVAGHYAGHHGLLGAAAGCVAGRQLAKRKAAAKMNTTNDDGGATNPGRSDRERSRLARAWRAGGRPEG